MLKRVKEVLKLFGIHKVFFLSKQIFYEWLVPNILVYKVELFFYLRHYFSVSKIKKHTLEADLIVSLTSYPPRFKTLHLTLKSLLLQDLKYDKLILWIAEQDKELLPSNVIELQSQGLTIYYCEDIKSYKKIIPALERFPNAFIVTVDDDTYYWESWLDELVSDHHLGTKEIIGHRGHFIKCFSNGEIFPYNKWGYEDALSTSSEFNFLTGVGGVMYPPHVLHHDVDKHDSFIKLCPQADDVWLYWMARLNNADIRRIKRKKRYFYFWPNTLQSALASNNVMNNGNDSQINNVNKVYKLF